jgi:hypothetical protein
MSSLCSIIIPLAGFVLALGGMGWMGYQFGYSKGFDEGYKLASQVFEDRWDKAAKRKDKP